MVAKLRSLGVVLLLWALAGVPWVCCRSPEHNKKKKKKQKKKRKHKRNQKRKSLKFTAATPEMFAGFEPEAEAAKNLKRYSQFRVDFKTMMSNIISLCEGLEEAGIFTCMRPRDKPWDFDGFTVNYHVAFGRFGVATVAKPVENAIVSANCRGYQQYQTDNCKYLKFTKEKTEGRFYVAKTPFTESSWQIYHILGRCVFWHKKFPDVDYRPFPHIIDLRGVEGMALEKNTKTLIFEYFAESSSYYKFHQVMHDLFPGRDTIINQYALRFVYLYTYWALLFAMYDFQHRDFHGDNVMLDLVQVKQHFGELDKIGLNSFYAIDLDTVEFPKKLPVEPSNLQEILDKESPQGRRADSVSVGFSIELCLEKAGEYEALQRWKDKTIKYCFDDSRDRKCSRERQKESLDFAIKFLWNFNIETDFGALANLHPPSELESFDCQC